MESQNEKKILDVIGRLEIKVDTGFSEMHQRFGQVDKRFEKIDERFGQVDKRFEKIDERFGQVDKRFEKMEGHFKQIDERFEKTESELMEAIHDLADQIEALTVRVDGLTTRVNRIESQMVTKDYLDRRINDLRGDLVALSRKVNSKLNVVVEQLVVEGTLKRQVADKILALEPFPVA